jgi:preprotein translocase subunit YajC|tara:strand:+ start:57225 stop:57554 length:330 start_codon:yes stop_codon:yes gene_type:complete
VFEFLIPAAQAQEAVPAEGNRIFSLVMFGGLFVMMYFMLIRPQKKRQKEHANLMGSLNKGDEVVLTSGLIGRVTNLSDDYLTVDTGTVELKFQRVSVHAVLPKGTIKSI